MTEYEVGKWYLQSEHPLENLEKFRQNFVSWQYEELIISWKYVRETDYRRDTADYYYRNQDGARTLYCGDEIIYFVAPAGAWSGGGVAPEDDPAAQVSIHAWMVLEQPPKEGE